MSAIPYTSVYLQCDTGGCDQTFLVPHDTDATAKGVRREASWRGWTVEEDRDYCAKHSFVVGGHRAVVP